MQKCHAKDQLMSIGRPNEATAYDAVQESRLIQINQLYSNDARKIKR